MRETAAWILKEFQAAVFKQRQYPNKIYKNV